MQWTGRKKIFIFLLVILVFSVSFELFIVFPPSFLLQPSQKKPVILYYEYPYPPLEVSRFPWVVNFTLAHGFNTLMLEVFYNHRSMFNRSTVDYFISYAGSRGLALVPSYYITATSDKIDVGGMTWVNLDMERLSPLDQRSFYDNISQIVPLVSVTSPYGQPVLFSTPMNIVETYASTPLFWLAQLGYYHPGKICSVGDWLLHSQQEYDAEKSYCLEYSDGVMVFDYYNLLRSGFR
jgi:hypothetical protein